MDDVRLRSWLREISQQIPESPSMGSAVANLLCRLLVSRLPSVYE